MALLGEPRLHFKIDPSPRFPGYPAPSGRLIAYFGEERVGFLDFVRLPRDPITEIHLEYLQVNPAFRGRRIGEAILRSFRQWLRRKGYPTRYASSDVISQRSFRALAAAYGPPLWVDDGIRVLTPEEALQRLPVAVETTPEGSVEAHGGVRTTHWIGAGRVPKDDPVRQRYLAEIKNR